MKTGDTIPVTIAGDVVAQAKVTQIDKDANTVTLIVPATKVVMGLRVEIDTAPAPVEEPTKQTIITGVDRVDAQGNVIEGASTGEPAPAGESAAVGGNTENAESANSANANTGSATPTPVGEATQTGLSEPVAPPVPPAPTPVAIESNED